MITPLVGCGLLILLAAIRVASGLKRMPRWYSLLIPLGLWLVIINVWLPLPRSYPDSPAPGLVLQAEQKLNAQDLAGVQYVILIEGSSLTMNGVDGNRVQSLLRQKGVPSLVIQFSCAGANHAERYEYLKEFLGALRPDQIDALRQRKLILCREVELGYDKNPVNNLMRNGSTGRSLRYLGPDNLPIVFSWLGLRLRSLEWIREHTVLAEVAGCGLFNLFHVGYVPRMEELLPTAKAQPFVPNLTQSPTFAASGSLETIQELAPDKREATIFSENLVWQRKRDSDFRNLFRGIAMSECFFAFPSWFQSNASYNVWRRQQPGMALCFDGTGTPLVKELAPPALWYDELHLQLPGAEMYSEEFAKYLAEKIQSKSL